MRKLAARRLGLRENGRDLRVVPAEELPEHEHEALLCGQALQQDPEGRGGFRRALGEFFRLRMMLVSRVQRRVLRRGRTHVLALALQSLPPDRRTWRGSLLSSQKTHGTFVIVPCAAATSRRCVP
jgi:hypothetical protein